MTYINHRVEQISVLRKAVDTNPCGVSAPCASGVLLCFVLVLMLSGCASGIFHEGAYVGNGDGYNTQGHPSSIPHSSVPIFASHDVKADARNRVTMERSTGRPVVARPATVNDVISWYQSGVHDANIITHIRTHGLYQPLQEQDVLTLQNRGVSTDVIRTMKEHPYPKVDAPVPPPRSQTSAFSGSSFNPDTNPGNGYYADSGNTGPNIQLAPSKSMPTVAPPVLPESAGGLPRARRATVAPQYGNQVDIGAGFIEYPACQECSDCPYIVPMECSACN